MLVLMPMLVVMLALMLMPMLMLMLMQVQAGEHEGGLWLPHDTSMHLLHSGPSQWPCWPLGHDT